MDGQFTLQDLLGGGLPAGLLSPEQEAAAQRRAQSAGLLNLAFGLLQSSRGQPGQAAPTLGQVIGQAGPIGLQGYQQSFDQTLGNVFRGMQVQEMRRKMAEQERLDKARQLFEQQVAGATKTVPSLGITEGGQQATMLGQQMQGFAPEDLVGTRQALMSAGATQQVTDQNAANQAVLNYLRVASPLEYAKLVAKEPKETFRPLTATEQASLKLPKDRAYQISTSGKISEVGQGPQVQILPGESATQQGYAKFGVEQNTKIYTAGQNAIQNIPKIDQTINLLQTGDAKTGFGADTLKNIARVQAAFTGSKKSIKEVSDTELLDSLLGSEVFPQIGALGIGARGLDTPAEREFLRQVMTGTILMNKDTLVKMAELRKKYETRSILQYNSAVDSGQLDPLFQWSGLPKRKLDVPPIRVNY